MARPVKYSENEKLQQRIDLYFNHCKINKQLDSGGEVSEDIVTDLITDDIFPTVTGLALALDLTRNSLLQYEGKPEFVNTIKKAKSRVEAFVEQRLYHNNAVGSIFNLKNNFGWKDKSETEHSGEMGLIDYSNLTDEQLAARKNLILGKDG